MKKVLLAWSSGKDSAWTLHALSHRAGVTVAGLLTTVNAAYDRVAMHGVRRALLVVTRDGLVFADLLPEREAATA